MWSTQTISSECYYSVLDDEKKTFLGLLLIPSGLLGAILNSWLIGSLFLKSEFISRTHILLLNLSMACLGHNLLAGFPFQATSAIGNRWLFGESCCQLFAFLQQFFGIGEVMAVMLLTMERYSLTKRYNLGNKAYIYSVLVTWIIPLIFASLPLFNIGRYACDIIGISCALDWHPHSQEDLIYIILYMILSAILPVLIIFWLMIHVNYRVHNYNDSKIGENQVTHAVTVLVILMLITWSPSGLVSLYTLLNIKIPPKLVFISPLTNVLSTLLPMVSFFCYDYRVRNTLMGTLYSDGRLNLKFKPVVIERSKKGFHCGPHHFNVSQKQENDGV